MSSTRTEQELFALRWETGNCAGLFHDFYPNLVCMRMCGKGPYYRVRVVADPRGKYWAWHNYEHDEFRHIYYARPLVDMCFVNGTEDPERLGQGKVIPVRVEDLGVAG